MPTARDPYEILGVGPDVSDVELRSVYRHLVQLHHPDHNGGSSESARRFEEIQAAYARIQDQRRHAERAAEAPHRTAEAPPRDPVDPQVESRLADLERELRQAQDARERARRAVADAAAATYKRPSDEELGYVRTDDSLSKLLADARVEFSERLAQAAEHPAGKRLADLIDELETKLTGRPPHDPQ